MIEGPCVPKDVLCLPAYVASTSWRQWDYYNALGFIILYLQSCSPQRVLQPFEI